VLEDDARRTLTAIERSFRPPATVSREPPCINADGLVRPRQRFAAAARLTTIVG
jgi:hypothetical protein